VERIVAVAGDALFRFAGGDFDQSVLRIVTVAGDRVPFALLRAIAVVVVLIVRGFIPFAFPGQPVVGVVSPGAVDLAVPGAVGCRVEGVGFGVAAEEAAGVGGNPGEPQFVVILIIFALRGAGVSEDVGARAFLEFPVLSPGVFDPP
jgi:hypothetical protein